MSRVEANVYRADGISRKFNYTPHTPSIQVQSSSDVRTILIREKFDWLSRGLKVKRSRTASASANPSLACKNSKHDSRYLCEVYSPVSHAYALLRKLDVDCVCIEFKFLFFSNCCFLRIFSLVFSAVQFYYCRPRSRGFWFNDECILSDGSAKCIFISTFLFLVYIYTISLCIYTADLLKKKNSKYEAEFRRI